MKTEKFSGQVESAWGKVLPKPVKFSGEFDAYETIDEVRAAKDEPKDEEIVSYRNAQRKAAARAAATLQALTDAGHPKPANDDPQVVLKNMIRNLILAKKSPEEARQIAETVLGYSLSE